MNTYEWSQDGDGAIAERLEAIEQAILTISNILSDITSDDNPRALKIKTIEEGE